LLQRAVEALQQLKSVKGRFVQTNGNGSISRGDLYLRRPGKARFSYDPPSGLSIVSDGHTVAVHDQRLKTFERYPLAATPLSIFLAQEIRVDRGALITSVAQNGETVSITARDGRSKGRGQITLDFSGSPLVLAGWTVLDARGQRIRVRISELGSAPNLGDDLFSIKAPSIQRGGSRPSM